MTATELIRQDPEYMRMRRKELQSCLDYFAKELNRIYSLMPMQGFKIDLKTGEMEQLPIPMQWQLLIDRVLKMKDEYIKTHFPEFYVD